MGIGGEPEPLPLGGGRGTVNDLTVPTEVRECDCPNWVIQCIHIGDKRVWLVDRDSPVFWEEVVKRGLKENQPCPGCGEVVGRFNEKSRFEVLGPGVKSEPDCICRIGLTMPLPYPALSQIFRTFEKANRAFQKRCDLVRKVYSGREE